MERAVAGTADNRWRMPSDRYGPAGLVREELASLLDELLVGLEDPGVAGVWVDH